MNIIVSVLVLALQRVPIVNRIPAVRDAGTIDGALKVVTKAFNSLSNVAAAQRSAEARLTAAIGSLEDERRAAQAVAAKAERIAKKFADLLD